MPDGFTVGRFLLNIMENNTSQEIRPHHETRKVKFAGIEADIDLLIAPLILRLWKHGIKTCQSCEENEPGVVWIQFPDYKNAKRFFDAVSLRASYLAWSNDFGCTDGEDCFSIRFDQDDLRTVLKQFPAKFPIGQE